MVTVSFNGEVRVYVNACNNVEACGATHQGPSTLMDEHEWYDYLDHLDKRAEWDGEHDEADPEYQQHLLDREEWDDYIRVLKARMA